MKRSWALLIAVIGLTGPVGAENALKSSEDCVEVLLPQASNQNFTEDEIFLGGRPKAPQSLKDYQHALMQTDVVAMPYPLLAAPVNRLATIPSEVGRELMLNLDGKAYVQLNQQIYPVVRLGATGHPVILVHPDNVELVPTVREVAIPKNYTIAQDPPVKVKLAGNQLIVSGNHRAAFMAVHQHQPLYVELTGRHAGPRDSILSWKTILMVAP